MSPPTSDAFVRDPMQEIKKQKVSMVKSVLGKGDVDFDGLLEEFHSIEGRLRWATTAMDRVKEYFKGDLKRRDGKFSEDDMMSRLKSLENKNVEYLKQIKDVRNERDKIKGFGKYAPKHAELEKKLDGLKRKSKETDEIIKAIKRVNVIWEDPSLVIKGAQHVSKPEGLWLLEGGTGFQVRTVAGAILVEGGNVEKKLQRARTGNW